MGLLFVWRKEGSSTTKEGQSPQWVHVRMDPSLRGTCVTPKNMALSLIHMQCMAMAMAWSEGGTRILHACIAGTHAGSGCCAIAEPCIPVGVNNVSHCFHLLMWYCMHVNGYFLCFCLLVGPFVSRASK